MSRQIRVPGAFRPEEPPPPWEPIELPPPPPAIQLGEATQNIVETFERLSAMEALPRQKANLLRLQSILKAAEAARDAAAAEASKAAGTVGIAPAGSAEKMLRLNRKVKEARFDVSICLRTVQKLEALLS